MEKIQAVSYGVVPFVRTEEGIRYLLLEQIGIADVLHWGLPKGSPKEGETPTETARREFEEETGNTTLKILPEPTFTETYTFDAPEGSVKKTVTYFIGELTDQKIRPQAEEIASYAWLDYESAHSKFTYDNGRNVLEKADRFIKENLDK